MEGVKRGGDRQQLHEVIRSCSMEATAALKQGEPNRLLELLAATGAFPMSLEEMNAALDPKAYVGRCPEQVEKYLEKIKPYTLGAGVEAEEINV